MKGKFISYNDQTIVFPNILAVLGQLTETENLDQENKSTELLSVNQEEKYEKFYKKMLQSSYPLT